MNAAVVAPTPVHTRRELIATLKVPDGKRVSTLEWMRTPVDKLSGAGMVEALDRTAYVLGLGTGAVDFSAVAPVKLAELASYGLHAKAAKIGNLKVSGGWRRWWRLCGSWSDRRWTTRCCCSIC